MPRPSWPRCAVATPTPSHGGTILSGGARMASPTASSATGEAEDAVQDAFLTLWRQADRLDSARGRLVGLLLTIVHRRALDWLRARSRRGGALGPLDLNNDPVEPSTLKPSPSPLSKLKWSARTWPRCCRNSESQREIAARLASPVGTVKSRSRLGLEKLRGVLQGSLADGL